MTKKAIKYLERFQEIELQRDNLIREIRTEFDEMCEQHGNLVIAEAHQMRGDYPLVLNDLTSNYPDAIIRTMSIVEFLLDNNPQYFKRPKEK